MWFFSKMETFPNCNLNGIFIYQIYKKFTLSPACLLTVSVVSGWLGLVVVLMFSILWNCWAECQPITLSNNTLIWGIKQARMVSCWKFGGHWKKKYFYLFGQEADCVALRAREWDSYIFTKVDLVQIWIMLCKKGTHHSLLQCRKVGQIHRCKMWKRSCSLSLSLFSKFCV